LEIIYVQKWNLILLLHYAVIKEGEMFDNKRIACLNRIPRLQSCIIRRNMKYVE